MDTLSAAPGLASWLPLIHCGAYSRRTRQLHTQAMLHSTAASASPSTGPSTAARPSDRQSVGPSLARRRCSTLPGSARGRVESVHAWEEVAGAPLPLSNSSATTSASRSWEASCCTCCLRSLAGAAEAPPVALGSESLALLALQALPLPCSRLLLSVLPALRASPSATLQPHGSRHSPRLLQQKLACEAALLTLLACSAATAPASRLRMAPTVSPVTTSSPSATEVTKGLHCSASSGEATAVGGAKA